MWWLLPFAWFRPHPEGIGKVRSHQGSLVGEAGQSHHVRPSGCEPGACRAGTRVTPSSSPHYVIQVHGQFLWNQNEEYFSACCWRRFLSYSEHHVTKSQLAFSSSCTHPALSHFLKRESSGDSWASPQVLQTRSGVRPRNLHLA